MKYIHVLDSGAFTWWNKRRKKTVGRPDWSMFSLKDGSEFKAYVDAYAEFCKKYKDSFDRCVNCDVIGNPKLSWDTLKYLEREHGINPIPVIHTLTPDKWLIKHLEAGYDYIGIGGAARSRKNYYFEVDRMFKIICDTANKLPLCKVHGFAATTHKQIVRYPWYTVDSVTWKKMAYYGQILVPPGKSNGKWKFDKEYQLIFIGSESKYSDNKNSKRARHFLSHTASEQAAIREWLEFIEVPFGSDKHVGVSNSSQERVAANIEYFLRLERSLPKWPWPFRLEPSSSLLEIVK